MEVHASALAAGFVIALGLIAAIGAQNAHVLRQGIAGQRVFESVSVCIFCDTVLMTAGVFGMGSLIARWPLLETITAWGGAVFLIAYGAFCLRAAFKTQALDTAGRVVSDFWPAIATVLGMTLLNPHVYLDTLVLIGGIGAQYSRGEQPSFTIGAVAASWVWFIALGYGARVLRPWFENPRAWQMLDVLIGVLMWTIALTLLL
jgi:L-lysine exporter family protein LysE/ArgO